MFTSSTAGVLLGVALILGAEFLAFYASGRGGGHIQSLILAAILAIIGFQVGLIGVVADAVSMNRKMTEEILYQARYTGANQRGSDSQE